MPNSACTPAILCIVPLSKKEKTQNKTKGKKFPSSRGGYQNGLVIYVVKWSFVRDFMHARLYCVLPIFSLLFLNWKEGKNPGRNKLFFR